MTAPRSTEKGASPCYCGTPRNQPNEGCVYHRARATEAQMLTEKGANTECAHEWLDRPESDTRECLICGIEVAG